MSSYKIVAKLTSQFAIGLIVGVLVGGVSCGQDESKKHEFDPAQLSGQWKYLEGKRAGEPANEENLATAVTITDKEFTLEGDGQTFVISYKVNPKTDPLEIDLEISEGPGAGQKAIGILRLADGKMTLCYDPTGAKRPDKFESDDSNGWHLFELARKSFDPDQLVGKWKYESGERAGAKIDAERLQSIVTISKDKFVVPAGPDAEFVMPYKVDDKQNPIAIDMTIESGPAPEGKASGIIKLADGKLTLCYDPTAAKRPADFKTTAEDGCFLFVLTKQGDEPQKKDETKKSESAPAKSK